MVIPTEHRSDAWSLTRAEWSATQELLRVMRDLAQERHQPDGWNIGWNVGEVGGQLVPHAHCHLVPRFADERHAGRGMRWWFKQPDNTRSGRGDI
jgi:diadenosine tetraphosphate (Ap4A) HIT family hydrolase